MKPNDSQVHSHFGVALVRELRMFKALVGREKNHQIRPLGHPQKGLEA
jgi:hypothetical protein